MSISEETKCFIDAQCRRCRKRIGWFGRAIDQPACQRCGLTPDRAAIERDQAEMDQFREILTELQKKNPNREILTELQKKNPNWKTWRKARVDAGLTLRNAAKLLDVTPTDLSDIEQGRKTPSEALTGRMARCYQGDNP